MERLSAEEYLAALHRMLLPYHAEDFYRLGERLVNEKRRELGFEEIHLDAPPDKN